MVVLFDQVPVGDSPRKAEFQDIMSRLDIKRLLDLCVGSIIEVK